MIAIVLMSCLWWLAVLCPPEAPVATPLPVAQNPDDSRKEPVRLPPKHLVLIVQGTVRQLGISHAVEKPTKWGGYPKGTASRFALRIIGNNSRVLSRIPLDLRRFDTDQDRINGPLIVECCKVKDPRIAMLVNVPLWPNAERYEFLYGDRPIGTVLHANINQMLQEAR